MKRTDLNKWAQVARRPIATLQPAAKPILRIRDLRGVRELEDCLLLYGNDLHRAEAEVAKVSRQLFGIAPEDTLVDDPYDDELDIGDHLTDDEAMQLLAQLGVDFSDGRGLPLRCTKLMSRAAEAAARGIKGKLPDKEIAGLAMFEDALIKSRDAFLAKKRKT